MKRMIIAASMIGLMLTVNDVAWALSAAPWQLGEVVDNSELIVVGKVTETGKGTVTVAVSETLKGIEVKSVSVTGIRKWRGELETLPKDKVFLLFLTKVDGEYQIVGSNRHLEGLKEPSIKEETKKVIHEK
jgi:hypothetical protein